MFPPLRHRALAALRAFVLLEDPDLEARVLAAEGRPAGPTATGRRAAAAAHRTPLTSRRGAPLRRRHGAVAAPRAHCTTPVERTAAPAPRTRRRTSAA